MRRQTVLALAIASVALLAPTAAARATTVARPGAATPVRALGDTIVYSAYDRSTERWQLTVREGGAAARRVGVPSSTRPFDADIGTDTKGAPQLAYQRCEPGCDLFVVSLADGARERPVGNANDPEHNDLHPTIWRGRLAWTRSYGTTANPDPVVYTKTLTQPRSQPSTRLPGVPERRCGDVVPTCGPTTSRIVAALELWGDRLAQVVFYGCEACSGVAQSELRLVSVRARSSAQVAFTVVGLNGQQFVGPSFDGGRLGWYRGCAVPEASCRDEARPWRYRISSPGWERAAPGEQDLSGFADTGSTLYEVADCADPPASDQPNCRIEALDAPAYQRTSAPLR